MKDTLASLLALVIMVIGLVMIVGGSRAVQFLFAPFLAVLRRVVQGLFVALIVLVLVVAAISSKRSSPIQDRAVVGALSQNGSDDVVTSVSSEAVRNGN